LDRNDHHERAVRNTNANSYPDGDSHSYSDSNPNSHIYSNTNADFNAHANTHSNTDRCSAGSLRHSF